MFGEVWRWNINIYFVFAILFFMLRHHIKASASAFLFLGFIWFIVVYCRSRIFLKKHTYLGATEGQDVLLSKRGKTCIANTGANVR